MVLSLSVCLSINVQGAIFNHFGSNQYVFPNYLDELFSNFEIWILSTPFFCTKGRKNNDKHFDRFQIEVLTSMVSLSQNLSNTRLFNIITLEVKGDKCLPVSPSFSSIFSLFSFWKIWTTLTVEPSNFHFVKFNGPKIMHGFPICSFWKVWAISTEGLSKFKIVKNQLACKNALISSMHVVFEDRRTVIFYQVCTPGYPADLTKTFGKILSLGLHLKVIFSFQIFSNVRIKPYP